MEVILNILVFIAAFFFMEFVAWFTHKYIMHGFLWNLHEDHHVQSLGFFQKNDSFFLIFAIPSAILIATGAVDGFDYKAWIGFGILLYGFAYFLFHEVLIHRRFKKIRKAIFPNPDSQYLRAVQYAHRMHHKHLAKENGESFGMLIVGKKYFKKIKEK